MSDLRLSYSKLSTYQTCQRKYYWAYVRNIELDAPAPALVFGTAWHAAMETWYRTQDVPQAIAAFNAQFPADFPGEKRRTREAASRMLERYHVRYHGIPLAVLAHEQWLEAPLSNCRYVARVDRIVQWDGGPVGLEHKTTSSLSYGFTRRFKPNLQVTGSIWLLQVEDPRITTMLIDAALVTPTAPREGDQFLRFPESVAKWELDEFVSLATKTAEEILTRGQGFDAFAPNWSACTQYGECAYRRLCISPPEVRERLISTDYRVKPLVEDPSNADT